MKPSRMSPSEISQDQPQQQSEMLRSIRSITWRLKAFLNKGYFRFQDRLGFYTFQDWCRLYEKRIPNERGDAPEVTITILIRVANADLHLLKDTITALVKQTHQNWEAHLILEDEIKLNLPAKLQADARINLLKNTSSPGWKAGIRASNGDWVVFMNCGDALAPDALARVSQEIKEHPTATIIYPDTDHLTDTMARHDPNFWPDWSPELLLSVNYLRSAFFKLDELKHAEQKTDDFEDALLLCTERNGQIIHVPHILYHQHDELENPWLEESFYPGNILAHLERAGLKDVTAQLSSPSDTGQYKWAFGKPLVSIIILTRDKVELLQSCLDSIFNFNTYENFEIILVENNSRESNTFAYYESLKSNPRVKVLSHSLPFNYSAFNNWAAQHTSGDFLLFLNNDIQCFEADWLEELARWASRPEIGVVGAKLLYPNGTIQHAGLVVGMEGHANHIFAKKREAYHGVFGTPGWYRDYSAVTGACMMMRREVFEQTGGFDENYSLAFNDIELCLRVTRAGYRVVYTPHARLIHHEGATRSKYKPLEDMQLAYLHLKTLIERGDPYYNPNLSLAVRVPTLRRPGEMNALQRLDKLLEYAG